MEGVTVVDHVLLGRLLSILRDKHTSHRVFRETMTDAALILRHTVGKVIQRAAPALRNVLPYRFYERMLMQTYQIGP